jgi:DUF4097 and DUF4098 domain-containing protein YvlB
MNLTIILEGLQEDLQAAADLGDERAAGVVARSRLEQHGDEIVIDVPGKIFGSTPRLRLVATVPTGSTLQVDTASAAVTVRGALGGLRAQTASGDVHADDVDGEVEVRTASGDINVYSSDASPVAAS